MNKLEAIDYLRNELRLLTDNPRATDQATDALAALGLVEQIRAAIPSKVAVVIDLDKAIAQYIGTDPATIAFNRDALEQEIRESAEAAGKRDNVPVELTFGPESIDPADVETVQEIFDWVTFEPETPEEIDEEVWADETDEEEAS